MDLEEGANMLNKLAWEHVSGPPVLLAMLQPGFQLATRLALGTLLRRIRDYAFATRALGCMWNVFVHVTPCLPCLAG